MKIVILSMLAAASIAATGCATVESPDGGSTSSYANKEDRVTGSRLPRSDSAENYQGAKAISGQEYRDYKSSTGLLGGQ